MQSIKFTAANAVLKAPENWDESKDGPCGDLFVRMDDETITSLWMPTAEELEILKDGGGVALQIYGKSQPPAVLAAVKVEMEEPPHGGEAVSPGEEPIEESAQEDSQEDGTVH